MFRNQYDGDITTWSPQGRIHQAEYALEAVKQGSACVGLHSKTHAVLVALKRSLSELASYQEKLVRVDDHVGVGFAGLASDARVLSNFMRTQALQSKMLFDRPVPIFRLVSQVSDKAQASIQRYGRRPYGVGLLVIGCDESGPHLYEFSPSGNCFDYVAMSIGARSQSAKTYLEKHFQSFASATEEELIVHGLRALNEAVQSEKGLTLENVSIGVVGIDQKFRMLEGEAAKPYLDQIDLSGNASTDNNAMDTTPA